MAPEVSVVIPTRNEGGWLAFTIGSILAAGGPPDFEIVVVDDGSTDGSVGHALATHGGSGRLRVVAGERQGPGRARNLGARSARGRFIVFIDGHCETPAGWLAGLVAPLRDPSVGLVGCAFSDLRRNDRAGIGAGCTWGGPALDMVWLPPRSGGAYPVPLLPGGCQALRAADAAALAYDPGMRHIGSEGEEQSLRCWLLGRQVLIEPAVLVRHLFRDRPPYEVRSGELVYNRLRLAAIHFAADRAARVYAALAHLPGFAEQAAALAATPVMAERAAWQASRPLDDDWFCARFGLSI